MKKLEYKSILAETISEAIKFKYQLYDKYDFVKLINYPRFSECGRYTFECSK